ncbi:MAG: hypothetical protein RIQ93_3085 [Verrucomicrobiota bacterium]|jgi:hypothetical protein
MHPLISRLVRRFNKRASPQPWDLAAVTSLDELLPAGTDLTLHLGPALQDKAAGDLFDGVTLAALVRARQPGRVFEIGTGFGRSATLFALNAPEARILTLSLPANPATGWIFHGQPWTAQIQQLEGDSATFDYTPWHRQMDFVFVDGWHKSPIVEKDTANAFKLVSPTGWIVWHDVDADTPDVLRCLGASAQSDIAWIKGTRYAIWRAR